MCQFDKTEKLCSFVRSLTSLNGNNFKLRGENELNETGLLNLKELFVQFSGKSERLTNYNNDIKKLISKEDQLENEIDTPQEFQEKIISFIWKTEDKIRKIIYQKQKYSYRNFVCTE